MNDKPNKEAKKQPAEIVEQPTVARQNDPLLEELNVVKLEGRYFCFDLREVSRRKGTLAYQDGERRLKIDIHPDYGQPSILAYRVLQAAFHKITLEGRPFPETVSFSFRELSRIIGRDVWGGKDAQEIVRAIRQLQRTVVTLSIDSADSKTKRWVEFSLVITSGFVANSDATSPSRVKTAVITLHPVIIDSMRSGHFVVFNWDRVNSLSPLSAALYKRLYLHLSNLFENKHNRATLKFEKDYEAICGEWLGGLQPYPYKSRIEQQLKPHLDALKDAGLIRSWGVERKADGKGYKLVFRPGAGFFADYDLFYAGSSARVLQFQRAADEASIHGPLELTQYFYQKLHKTQKLDTDIFPEKDVQFAETILRRYGMDESHAIVDFTLASAETTKFAIKNIRAIEVYLPAWEANRDAREQSVARQKERAQQEREDKLKEQYDTFIRKHVFDRLATLSPDDRSEIKTRAEANASQRYGRHNPAFNMSASFEERKLVLERWPVPSFEDWSRTRS